MTHTTEALPESIVVELSPGTAVVFGRVPDGLDLIPFRLLPLEDRAELVVAISATSPVLDVGEHVTDEFVQPKGLVQLNQETLDAWRPLIRPSPSSDYFDKTWHAGTERSQIRWLPAPQNTPSVVLARLDLAAPMLRIQTRLDAVLRFPIDDVALADSALQAARPREWAELWNQAQAVTDALNEAAAGGDPTPEVLDKALKNSPTSSGEMRDRYRQRLAALADEWDEKWPPELVRFVDANAEEALLDLYGFLIAHKSQFEYRTLRAARSRLDVDRKRTGRAWLDRVTDDMLEAHTEMIGVAGKVLSTVDFSRVNWHLRKLGEPGHTGPTLDRPEWGRLAQQLGVATRTLRDSQ